VFLLVSALVAVFPNAARASIENVFRNFTRAASGSVCTIPNLNTLAATPGGLILVSVSGSNPTAVMVTSTSGLGSPHFTELGFTMDGSGSASVAIFETTDFTPSALGSITLTLTGVGGIGGYVCGAVVFSGVASVGTFASNTGTSITASGQPNVTVTSPGPGGVVFDTLSSAAGGQLAPSAGQVAQWTLTGQSGKLGAASVAPPTTTMSWTLFNNNAPWVLAAVPLIPLSTTEVQPTSFTVTQHTDRNLIELKTGREVSSLGFNLYREQNGRRVRLNSSLLAGTALLAGSETTLTAGHVHTWWDTPTGDRSSVSYWVEEVDLHGQRTWYGAATP
jgi:hypothetical protein